MAHNLAKMARNAWKDMTRWKKDQRIILTRSRRMSVFVFRDTLAETVKKVGTHIPEFLGKAGVGRRLP